MCYLKVVTINTSNFTVSKPLTQKSSFRRQRSIKNNASPFALLTCSLKKHLF